MPKSFEDLEKQVSAHYADDEASVQRRLNKAKMEMELAPLFRHTVTNEDPEEAYQEIKKIIKAEQEKAQ